MKSLIVAFALVAVACGAALPSRARLAAYDNSAIDAIVAAINSDSTDEATKPLLEALLIEALGGVETDHIAIGSGDVIVPAPTEDAIVVAPVIEGTHVAESVNSPLVEIILNINTNEDSQAIGIAAPAMEKPTPVASDVSAQVEAVSVVSPVAPVEPVSVVSPIESVSVVSPVQAVSVVSPVITEAVSVVNPVYSEAVSVVAPETPESISIAGIPEIISSDESIEAVSVMNPVETVSVVNPVEAVSTVNPAEAVSVVAPVEAVSVVSPIIPESVSDVEHIAIGSGDVIVPAPIDIAHPAIEAIETAAVEESAPIALPPSPPLVEIILNINSNGESQAVNFQSSAPALEKPTPIASAISTPTEAVNVVSPVESVSVVSPVEAISVIAPVVTEAVSVVNPVITEAVSVVAPVSPGAIGIAAIPDIISV